MLTWVDDIVVASGNASMLNEVKTMLSQKFKIKGLGVIFRFLGIDFKAKPGKISMGQENYLSKVLEIFDMTKCKPKSLPSEQKLIFFLRMQNCLIRQNIGKLCLIYVITCTRPDISWIVTKIAQYSRNPTVDHWTAVKRVLKYLKWTLDYKLCSQKYENCLTLTGFSDADWEGSADRRVLYLVE